MTTLRLEMDGNTLAALSGLFEKVFTTGASMKITINFMLRANPRVDNSEELTAVVSSMEIEIK